MRAACWRGSAPRRPTPIDEFLNLALAYDDARRRPCRASSAGCARADREIKRDMEQGRNEVRVMTVHGAKGLEAPIVFLPDTCSTRSGRQPGRLLLVPDMDAPGRDRRRRSCGRSRAPASSADRVQQAEARMQTPRQEERNRLLYVALTRARDRLYVAGFEGSKAPPAGLLVQSHQNPQ